jgi:malate dehydrogenase (oxaloacetate-decarboxylating)
MSNGMLGTNKKSLALHKKYRGKLEIKSKVSLNNARDLCVAYTPGVAEACKMIARHPKLANIYTIKQNTVAVITDGSAVLGLGNIGPLAALPVMEGKCILHKRFANIDSFPICLGTQDTEKIIETIKLIAPVFGAIHLEDISAPRCFEIEKRLQDELDIPVLHDDQHSTAVVVLAALINALHCRSNVGQAPGLLNMQARGLPYRQMMAKIIINGAGAAGIGIAKLLMGYGFKNLIMLDSHGALYIGRPGLTADKLELAKMTKNKTKGGLADCLKGADVFIGVSKGGLLKPQMIRSMNKKPIIFAIANPTPEIMPAEAKKAGAFIVATGRSDFQNQINNVLTFPGIFRGALDNHVKIITQKMLIQAATNLAALIKSPTSQKILPSLFDKNVVKAIAKAIK